MPKSVAFIVHIYQFLRYEIWQVTDYELSGFRRRLHHVIKTVILAVRGFIVDNLYIRASALVYSILFAIIPLFALIIAIGKGFGFDKIVEESLQGTLVGQAQVIPAIMDFVNRYLKSAQGGIFIGVGLIILLWSVMSLFRQIEKAFNSVWQVKRQRSFGRQLSTYLSSVLIIPFLIIFSSGLSIFFNSKISQSYIYDVLTPILRFGIKFTPYVVNWIVFSVLYLVMPNTRVKLSNAAIAGLVAGTLFQLFQLLYIHGQNYLSRYNVVYGGFAAIPLLFIWLQVSCLIVLFGAEISYASQNIQNFEYEFDTNHISTRYKNFLILFITHIIVKRFENQESALTAEQIAHTYRLPIRIVNQLISKLVKVSILVEVKEGKITTYMPAFDINQLTVNLLFNTLDNHGSELFLTNKNELLDSFWQKTLAVKTLADDNTNHILVKDL
ncbi:MAG: YihY/virulence factor BrkB family protein [Paludibacter sp.]